MCRIALYWQEVFHLKLDSAEDVLRQYCTKMHMFMYIVEDGNKLAYLREEGSHLMGSYLTQKTKGGHFRFDGL